MYSLDEIMAAHSETGHKIKLADAVLLKHALTQAGEVLRSASAAEARAISIRCHAAELLNTLQCACTSKGF